MEPFIFFRNTRLDDTSSPTTRNPNNLNRAQTGSVEPMGRRRRKIYITIVNTMVSMIDDHRLFDSHIDIYVHTRENGKMNARASKATEQKVEEKGQLFEISGSDLAFRSNGGACVSNGETSPLLLEPNWGRGVI